MSCELSRSPPFLFAGALLRERVVGISEWIVWCAGLDRDPTEVGELRDAGLATEPAVPAGLDTAKWHLRFVSNRWPIDVADARLDEAGHPQRAIDVLAEDRGCQPVLGIVRR